MGVVYWVSVLVIFIKIYKKLTASRSVKQKTTNKQKSNIQIIIKITNIHVKKRSPSNFFFCHFKKARSFEKEKSDKRSAASTKYKNEYNF